MLEQFTVDNFQSLINVVFRPRERSLLLGENNAGKTNLCHAMRFLSGTTRNSLAECADYTTGTRAAITNLYFQKPSVEFSVRASLPFEGNVLTFEYRLVIRADDPRSFAPAFEVEQESLHVTAGGMDGVALLENTPQGSRALNEGDVAHGALRYVESQVPKGETALKVLFDAKAHPRTAAFKEYLFHWQYYALCPQALRGTSHLPNHTALHTDGSNLGSVIYQLKTSDERRYRRLLECVKVVEPRVDAINFLLPSADRVFMLFEDARGNRLPAARVSEGTLRYLALSYLLMGQPPWGPSPLRIIEEPENGIYVGHLRDLLALVEDSAAPQIVFTSHSPYFIDLFDDRLESVFVMQRGQFHSSLVQPDVQKVRERLERFPLGEQHFRRMLQ